MEVAARMFAGESFFGCTRTRARVNICLAVLVPVRVYVCGMGAGLYISVQFIGFTLDFFVIRCVIIITY